MTYMLECVPRLKKVLYFEKLQNLVLFLSNVFTSLTLELRSRDRSRMLLMDYFLYAYNMFDEMSNTLSCLLCDSHFHTLFTHWVMIPFESFSLMFVLFLFRFRVDNMSYMICNSSWRCVLCILTSHQGYITHIIPYILTSRHLASWRHVSTL